MNIPETLAHRMEIFSENGYVWNDQVDLFRTDSWVQVMMGQGLMPGGYHNIADAMSDQQLKGFLAEIRSSVNQTLTRLSVHKAFIERYVSR